MKIGEISQKTRIATKTIRYYEEIGLLPQPLRNASGYRDYRDADVARLVFVRRCRELQIPLEQIKKLVSVQMDNSASCREIDQIIEKQLEKVRQTQAELALLEKTLSTLAYSCQQGSVRDCQILRQLRKH